MQKMIRVAVDAMGGDNAPDEIVKGVVEAVGLREDIKVFLVGKEELVKEKLKAYSYKEDQIEIVEEEGLLHCSGFKDGKGRKGRCLCVSRKFRRGSGRRTAVGGTHPGRGAASPGAVDSYKERCFPPD